MNKMMIISARGLFSTREKFISSSIVVVKVDVVAAAAELLVSSFLFFSCYLSNFAFSAPVRFAWQ